MHNQKKICGRVPLLLQAQKPSAADAAALIEMTRATTLAYSASLPDFVCTEVISRYRQVAAFADPTLRHVS